MVRRSKNGGETNPYAITVFHLGCIYNVLIRRRPDGKWALGAEKSNENVCLSLTYIPIILF